MLTTSLTISVCIYLYMYVHWCEKQAVNKTDTLNAINYELVG